MEARVVADRIEILDHCDGWIEYATIQIDASLRRHYGVTAERAPRMPRRPRPAPHP